MEHAVLRLSQRTTLLPVVHGSGDFAIEVRRFMLENEFDCLAVPLPPSFQEHVEEAIHLLPSPTMVVQPESTIHWQPEDVDTPRDAEPRVSFVPLDPCQPVIAALRIAMGEHIPRAFIDLETASFQPQSAVLPDSYALKRVPADRFAAAVLPSLPPPPPGQARDRVAHMARRIRRLEERFRSVLFVCSLLDWPWIRDQYRDAGHPVIEEDQVEDTSIFAVEPATLIFMYGELPFITGLYEQARAELADDENLSVDGVKELLIAARDSYLREMRGRARRITPHALSVCLRYIRNLTLTRCRLTPDLYTIVMAAKQTVGDGYALHVAEQARRYPFDAASNLPSVSVGIERLRLPDGGIAQHVNRLPGPPVEWRSCQLQRRASFREKRLWAMRWNPLAQCSWPLEDELIEDFRAHVSNRALAIMGADLANTEKFTTSIKDGIDIRETLRHWHTGDIYVKVLPPNRGTLDAVVMLFDSPADPRDYPWRTTWFAEHQNESTLAFFATNYREELVGPGIGLATYGGALFLFPPRSIDDIWTDPRLDIAGTLEERLLIAACVHSDSPHVALLSHHPPGAAWRRLSRRFGKKWVHVPLGGFGDSTVAQLRMVHVLNGRQVRSYAAHFIRRG